MTIKNLTLSIAASAMIVTTAMAANPHTDGHTIAVNGGGTISQELINVTDVNVSLGNFTITADFDTPSSRNNPVFEFNFTPASGSLTADLANCEVFEVNASGEYNRSNPLSNGYTANDATGFVSFAKSTGTVSITDGKKYAILKAPGAGDNNATNPVNIPDIKVLVSDAASAAATHIDYAFYTGDSGLLITSDSKDDLYSIKPEYSIKLNQALTRRTNICSGYKVFDTTSTNGCSGDDNSTDTIIFDMVRTDMTYDFNATAATYLRITGDSNLTAFDTAAKATTNTVTGAIPGAGTHTGGIFQHNTTFPTADTTAMSTAGAQYFAMDYNVTTATKIEDTKFDWKFVLVSIDGNTSAAGSTSSGSAGEWKPYGYAAQIPNVTTSSALSIETVINITNTGGSAKDVYFTLVGNSTECSVNTADNTSIGAQLPANGTVKYNASDLLAACPSITDGSFGLELDISASPTDIYTSASFRNASGATKVFKDLPVYSTSSLNY